VSRDDYPYPEDEFDTLGEDRVPQGVHRAPLPRWRQLLPFLIVLVLAPTLAFVAVRVLTGGEPGSDPTQSTTAPSSEVTTSAGEEPTSETTEEPSSEEPEETTPAVELDLSIQIWVLNGSGQSGLAADAVAILDEAGWQDANADDYGSSLPSDTTLFYDNADQAEEAQAVGEQLGITNLVESADAADGDIVIVLRADFTLP
jgi:hypothetical protein